MSCAWKDKAGWIASFRKLHGTGRQLRRVRVPASRMPSAETAETDAKAHAAECDHYCRLLERESTDGKAIEHARSIGAISERERRELIGIAAVSSDRKAIGPPTIRALAASHPSSMREEKKAPKEFEKYLKYCDIFSTLTGVWAIADVRLSHIQDYLAAMRTQGLAWDTRRHRLLYLRRACRMATSIGLPDVVGDLRLDSSDQEREVEAWTLTEVLRGLAALRKKDNRALAAMALGAMVGLRNSEICRIQVRDLDGDVLRVGVRERKNAPSRRDLPLPATVALWLRNLAGDRPGEEPLIKTLMRGKRAGPFPLGAFGQWLAPIVAKATGRTLPATCLRKSFATWTSQRGGAFRIDQMESFLGHSRTGVAAVTSRHYLAAARVAELRPFAEAVELVLIEGMLAHGKQPTVVQR